MFHPCAALTTSPMGLLPLSIVFYAHLFAGNARVLRKLQVGDLRLCFILFFSCDRSIFGFYRSDDADHG